MTDDPSLNDFSGHSPGPWTLRPAAGGPDVMNAAGTHVGRVYGWQDSDNAANARLMAAAPTLLAERDALRAQLDEAKIDTVAFQEALEAIVADYNAKVPRLKAEVARLHRALHFHECPCSPDECETCRLAARERQEARAALSPPSQPPVVDHAAPGLRRALRIVDYHRAVLSGNPPVTSPAPGVMATLDRVESSIKAELENGGPLTSPLAAGKGES